MLKIFFGSIILTFIQVSVGSAVVHMMPSSEYATIQAAIDDCNDGDTVVVAPGLYTGDGNRDIRFRGKAITVRSNDPNDPNIVIATVIDCNGTEGNYHCGFIFDRNEGLDSVLSGFTVTRGYYGHGGAIYGYDYAGPTILNCHIVGNRAMRGGGIYMSYGRPYIGRCRIEGNSAIFPVFWGEGGGIYLGSYGTISDCIVTGNTAVGEGKNLGRGGGIHIGNAEVAVIHCTIADNTADEGGGIYCNEYGSITMSGCIVWGNTGETSSQIWGTPQASFCDVQEGFAGDGNINEDPLFVDVGSGNYHLMSNSPCIDKGDPDYVPWLRQKDIDGQIRIMGDRIDIGADEVVGDMIPVMDLSAEFLRFNMTANADDPNTQVISIRNAGGADLHWSIGSDVDWLHIEPLEGIVLPASLSEIAFHVNGNGLLPGIYQATIQISALEATNQLQTMGATVFVRNASGLLDVPSVYPTIQDAISSSEDGDVVIIAPGIYTGQGNRDINLEGKAITVRSIDPNAPNCVDATVIVCNGTVEDYHRGFIFDSQEDANTVLSGLTISGGCEEDGAGLLIEDAGPTVVNCVIRDNLCASASRINYSNKWGGGIYVANGSPRIIDCIISDNTCSGYSTRGGGVGCYQSTPLIQGCVVSGNTTRDGGAGIYCYQSTDVVVERCLVCNNEVTFRTGGGVDLRSSNGDLDHCLIVKNEASYGGAGLYLENSDVNIVNCTIADNSADSEHSGGIYTDLCSVNILNSIIWGNTNPWDAQIFVYSWCGYLVRGYQESATTTNADLTVSYSDIQNGQEGIYVYNEPDYFALIWGEGNLDANPWFASELYETDSKEDNEGEKEDVNDDDGSYVPSVRSLSLLSWNDHMITDYHLRSEAGRWDPNAAAWILDDVTSSCIDAGDPNSPIGWERRPNGGVINMGAYGGTLEASRSTRPGSPLKSWQQRYDELLATMEPVAQSPSSSWRKRGYLYLISLETGKYFPVPDANGLSPDEIAIRFFKEWQDVFMYDSAAIDFGASRVTPMSYGYIVHLYQTYAGLHVYTADAVFKINNEGGVRSVTISMMVDPRLFEENLNLLVPTITSYQAGKIGEDFLASMNPGKLFEAYNIKLLIYDPEIIVLPGVPRLVWNMIVETASGNFGEYITIDAHTGEVVLRAPRWIN